VATSSSTVTGPAAVSIMRQGLQLIVSVHTALDDPQLARFQRDLIRRIGEQRTSRVIIDVAALDVVDSFTAHILAGCATMARLRGAQLTVVGLQPDVAFTMVELGLTTDPAHTALDLQDGLDQAARLPPTHPSRRPTS
jgi:rsbT antagonist protein RsbS